MFLRLLPEFFYFQVLSVAFLTLILVGWRGGGGNNSETVIAVTLAFYQRHLCQIWKYGFPNSDGSISNFWISGQSLTKENCHNSRTSNDIDMKLGPVTENDKKNKIMSTKFDNDFMLANRDVVVIFPICGQFGAIGKLDSGCILCKTYIFIKSNLLSFKN